MSNAAASSPTNGTKGDFLTLPDLSCGCVSSCGDFGSSGSLSPRVLLDALDSLPDPVMILGRRREIVFGNRALLQFLGIESVDELRGLRPGDALRCKSVNHAAEGCGSGLYCSACSVLDSLLAAEDGQTASRDCVLTRRTGECVEAHLVSSPLQLGNQSYVLLVIRDVSAEKRRSMLERLFFHDVLNSAGTIRGFAEVLESLPPDRQKKAVQGILRSVDHLIDEIKNQRDLTKAENGEIELRTTTCDLVCLWEETIDRFSIGPFGHIRIVRELPRFLPLKTDEGLLRRVLDNLLKNALEATADQGPVRISAFRRGDRIVSSVQNRGVMDTSVQLQVFQRSFSTKGPGRGLGTYSIRLLTERYLQGRVWFSSSAAEGTTFHLELPKVPTPVALDYSV